MTYFGEAFYGDDLYGADPYRLGTALEWSVVCRIVKAPPTDIPPVIDTWYYGLSQRFNWLQQGIQTFGLANKIEYAAGSDLDDIWGEIYDLPRRTSESDADYRVRLQTYSGILGGSGTPGNLLPLLNFLVGKKTGIELVTRWPAQVTITSDDVEVLRAIRLHYDRLVSVLPGAFAAGVEYSVLTPFLDFEMDTVIRGDADLEIPVYAAIQSEPSETWSMDTTIAFIDELTETINVAIQAERELTARARAAVATHRSLTVDSYAAIQGDADLTLSVPAAVQSDRSRTVTQNAAVRTNRTLETSQYAAISKTFDRRWTIRTAVWLSFYLECSVETAIQDPRRELTVSIRTRIKKP